MRWLVIVGLALGNGAFAQTDPAPAAAHEEPKAGPSAETAPPPAPAEATDVTAAPSGTSALRMVSYPVFGLGIVSAAVGIYFGAAAQQAKDAIMMDLTNPSISQQSLYDRDQTRIGQAQAANALLITAGILAAAAVVMFILGG